MLLAATEPPLTRFAVGLGALAIGALLIRDALRSLAESADRRRGPTASGRILSSRVEGPSGPELDTWYLHVVYLYDVDGRPYAGTRIAPTQQSFGSWWSAMWHARKYEPGAEVRVYFDPAMPDRAILDPRLTLWTPWMFLLTGTAAVLWGTLELAGVAGFRRE